MCGDKAAAAQGCLSLSYPVENGIVRDWEDMERLWAYTWEEKLKVNLTQPPTHRPLS